MKLTRSLIDLYFTEYFLVSREVENGFYLHELLRNRFKYLIEETDTFKISVFYDDFYIYEYTEQTADGVVNLIVNMNLDFNRRKEQK